MVLGRKEIRICFSNSFEDSGLTEKSSTDEKRSVIEANHGNLVMLCDSHECVDDAGNPYEYAGSPGEYVIVVIDYNMPVVVPFISTWWPQIRFSSQRLARVEDYRARQAVAPPPDYVTDTPTPTLTPTHTFTPTHTMTVTPSLTPSKTPTPTSTPDCSLYTLEDISVIGAQIVMQVRNQNPSGKLTGSSLVWNKFLPTVYVDSFEWGSSTYYNT